MRHPDRAGPANFPRLGGLLVVGLYLTLIPRAAAAACPASGDTTARVVAVEPRLELRLADGRLVRLAGFETSLQTPLDPDLAETARRRLEALLKDRDVSLHMLGASPDRWGRLPAYVFAKVGEAAGGPGGIAPFIVGWGLGRYLAEPPASDCRDALIAAEQKARFGKLGLWNDPYYAVLAVDDNAGFIERAGTIVLAEGRLAAVHADSYRTTLRFAAPDQYPSGHARSGQSSSGGHMLVATIVPHAMKIFEARSLDFRSHIGERIRFRGLLDLRFGPRVELASPDQVEILASPTGILAPQIAH
jgi:endonuclease YncB( thermonuclease family)